MSIHQLATDLTDQHPLTEDMNELDNILTNIINQAEERTKVFLRGLPLFLQMDNPELLKYWPDLNIALFNKLRALFSSTGSKTAKDNSISGLQSYLLFLPHKEDECQMSLCQKSTVLQSLKGLPDRNDRMIEHASPCLMINNEQVDTSSQEVPGEQLVINNTQNEEHQSSVFTPHLHDLPTVKAIGTQTESSSHLSTTNINSKQESIAIAYPNQLVQDVPSLAICEETKSRL